MGLQTTWRSERECKLAAAWTGAAAAPWLLPPADPAHSHAVQQGLLAGGLADGSVVLWDPAAIVERKEGVSPLLAKMQKHKGEASPMGSKIVMVRMLGLGLTLWCTRPHSCLQVKGLEFNTFSPNLLASGAADGELCIWDLAKPSAPTLYPALKVRCVCRLGFSM